MKVPRELHEREFAKNSHRRVRQKKVENSTPKQMQDFLKEGTVKNSAIHAGIGSVDHAYSAPRTDFSLDVSELEEYIPDEFENDADFGINGACSSRDVSGRFGIGGGKGGRGGKGGKVEEVEEQKRPQQKQ